MSEKDRQKKDHQRTEKKNEQKWEEEHDQHAGRPAPAPGAPKRPREGVGDQVQRGNLKAE